MPKLSIGTRLRAISSATELDDLLRELAAERSRWTKSAVLQYLPQAFHDAAGRYFAGEKLAPPHEVPPPTPAPKAVEIAVAVTHALNVAAEVAPESSPSKQGNQVRPAGAAPAEPPSGGPIRHMWDALHEEIKAVNRTRPTKFRLKDGRCTGPIGHEYTYVFTWSSDPDPFVPGFLMGHGEEDIPARVGAQCDGKRYELLTPSYLGPTIGTAVFRTDPAALLRGLAEKLAQASALFDSDVGFAKTLIEGRFPAPVTGASVDVVGLNRLQGEAAILCQRLPVSFVWGPPGTGKTRTLGSLTAALAKSGKRVAVLSPYNIAVDEAVLAADASGGWSPGDIVRFGRVGREVKRRQLDLESLLEGRAIVSGVLEAARQLYVSVLTSSYGRSVPDTVRGCLEALGHEVIRAHSDNRAQAKSIEKAVTALRLAFRAPEAEIVSGAKILGSTVTLSWLSDLPSRRSYDHTFVDEASVVRTPDAVIAALLGSPKLSFFGDPRQLPPIVEEPGPLTDQWLRRTPFDLAGIHNPGDGRDYCVQLLEQRRMAPPISRLVSELFYQGKLTDAASVPRPGRLVLMDTSLTPARATARYIGLKASRENTVHRVVVAGLLRELRRLDPDTRILVLCPYRAQKKAYESEPTTAGIPHVKFGTVHASQGTERRIVVLDLVLAPGRGKSRFMDDRASPAFVNLLNVALSRAKEGLFVVAHVDYIARTYPQGILDRMLTMMETVHGKRRCPADLRLAGFMKTVAAGIKDN